MKHKKMFVMIVMSVFLFSGSVIAQDVTTTKYGTAAGKSCTVANQLYNSFFGFQAGYSNTSAKFNTFLGCFAGLNTKTGDQNTFVGFKAGDCNTASYNTFLGCTAGHLNNTGEANTFLGYQAGYSNNKGNNNAFLGTNSGFSNDTGNSNTFLGTNSGKSNKTGNENTFLGCQAGSFNTASYNTFLGTNAGYSNKTGNDNTFVGFKAGYNSVGSRNVFIGNNAGYNESGSDKLYIANGPNPNNILIYGDFSNVKVGIGKTDPAYTLDVNGTIHGDTVNPSDVRLKKDVKPIKNALDNITQLRGITFRWKDNKKDNGQHLGVIAQEVETVFPEVVFTDNNGYKSVDYSKLAAPLIEAVKELKAENDALKARLEALEKKIKD